MLNDRLERAKLPSKKQALSLFLHLHQQENKTIRTSASSVVARVVEFWSRERIPVVQKDHAISKVEKSHATNATNATNQNLKKRKNKKWICKTE